MLFQVWVIHIFKNIPALFGCTMENKCCRPWVAQLLSECCSLLSCAAVGWRCLPRAWPRPQGTACRGNQARANLNRGIFTIWGKAGRCSIPGIGTVSKLVTSNIPRCLWAPKDSCTSVMLKSLSVWCWIPQPEPHHVAHVPTCPSRGQAAALGFLVRHGGLSLRDHPAAAVIPGVVHAGSIEGSQLPLHSPVWSFPLAHQPAQLLQNVTPELVIALAGALWRAEGTHHRLDRGRQQRPPVLPDERCQAGNAPADCHSQGEKNHTHGERKANLTQACL